MDQNVFYLLPVDQYVIGRELDGALVDTDAAGSVARGSTSTKSTFLCNLPSPAATFTAVVVLPTPPFWFAIAITFVKKSPVSENFTENYTSFYHIGGDFAINYDKFNIFERNP